MSRLDRHLRCAVLAVLLGALALSIVVAPAMAAPTATLTFADAGGHLDPVERLERTLTITVTGAPADSKLFVKSRKPATTCAASAAADPGDALQFGTVPDAFYGATAVTGDGQVSGTGRWARSGGYRFCIWLAPDEGTAVVPITQDVYVRETRITTVWASAQPVLRPGQTAVVHLRGDIEGERRGWVKAHAGHRACAASYASDDGTSLIAAQDVTGKFDTTTTWTPPTAGAYELCAWMADAADDPVAKVYGPSSFTVLHAREVYERDGSAILLDWTTEPGPAGEQARDLTVRFQLGDGTPDLISTFREPVLPGTGIAGSTTLEWADYGLREPQAQTPEALLRFRKVTPEGRVLQYAETVHYYIDKLRCSCLESHGGYLRPATVVPGLAGRPVFVGDEIDFPALLGAPQSRYAPSIIDATIQRSEFSQCLGMSWSSSGMAFLLREVPGLRPAVAARAAEALAAYEALPATGDTLAERRARFASWYGDAMSLGDRGTAEARRAREAAALGLTDPNVTYIFDTLRDVWPTGPEKALAALKKGKPPAKEKKPAVKASARVVRAVVSRGRHWVVRFTGVPTGTRVTFSVTRRGRRVGRRVTTPLPRSHRLTVAAPRRGGGGYRLRAAIAGKTILDRRVSVRRR